MIKLIDIHKQFSTTNGHIDVLKDISLTIKHKESVAITGPSGSGKSTLLALMAGLDSPTSGKIYLDEEDIGSLSEDQLAVLRGKKVGFIFQNFQLLNTLTALENVLAPAQFLPEYNIEKKTRAEELLKQVGLENRMTHFPSQLSGGEMQRVAIARAFINEPVIIFADEPTGNLDSKNGKVIIDLLFKLNKKTTLILVTHNSAIAKKAKRQVQLKDGKIVINK